MNIMSRLAIKQLLKNKKRTLITLAGIILSVAMVTAVAGFVVSTQDLLIRTYILHNGDYHAGIYPVTDSQAGNIANDYRVEGSFTKTNGDGVLAVCFRIRNVNRKYEQTAEDIAKEYDVTEGNFLYNKELLAAEGIIAGDQSLRAVYSIGIVLGSIILCGSIIVISNAFYISSSERIRQFGVLKSAGATKRQIRQTVLAEGLALSVIGIPLGVLTGIFVETAALAIANRLLYEISRLNNGSIYFKMVFSGMAILISVAISLVTVFFSAWFPAGRAAGISAIDAIRLSGEIKVRPGQVKTSSLIQTLFGFEGSLAAKALKRSRGKYRATVISLVVSITLFIIGSGFGLMVSKSTDMIYKDHGVNVLMNCEGGDAALLDSLNARFTALPDAEIGYARTMPVQLPADDSFFTDDAKEYLAGTPLMNENNTGMPLEAKLISLDDASFDAICQSAGISKDSFDNEDILKGILVNTAMRDLNGRRVEFQPFDNSQGLTLTITPPHKDEQYALELAGSVTTLPTSAAAVSFYEQINIILPESVFEVFARDMPSWRMFWVVQAQNPAEFSSAAEEIFKERLPKESYFVFNYEQGAKMNRDISLLMMIFVYSFIAMLSLIAVTSVIGTISTNINLRAQEFAMLSSVGMTPKGLRRMLNLESLFYGLKALFIGLPLAFALYYLLYKAFGITIGFAFIWPWQSILVCIAAVMGITFGTMRYSTKKLAETNIVEALKEVNI